jgi:hypothetical protein
MTEELDLVEIKNDIAWFASNTSDLTMDLQVHHTFQDRTFDFKVGDKVLWCYEEEYGYYVAAKQDKKILTLFLEETEEGFEITGSYILNIIQEITKLFH